MRTRESPFVQKDIDAIAEFLEDMPEDAKKVAGLLKEIDKLEQERMIARKEALTINIKTQMQLMDRLLELYQFLQDDIAINGERIGMIANQLLHHAKNAGIDSFKEKKKSWKL